MGARRRARRDVVGIALCLALVCALGVLLADGAAKSPKEICFANLAQLAQATLMYVADNDGCFPPQQAPMEPYECHWGADSSNPWLRWPVVLDSYVGDRSLYLCPAVEVPKDRRGAASAPYWITTQRVSKKVWPEAPCGVVYPPGWGGSITDSATQGRCEDPERFRSTMGGAMASLNGRRLSDVEDLERHVLWADSSRLWLYLGTLVYANACRADCADLDDRADWENCPWSQTCGAGGDFAANPDRQKRFTRHEGGSNIAFLDGHVKWMSVEQMIQAHRGGELVGISPHTKTKGEPWYMK